MAFKLPSLNYDYKALQPHFDGRTMKIHHTKHHQGYTDKLNKAIEGTDLEGQSIEYILSSLDMDNSAVRNNGGGFYNHSLFWTVLSPTGGGEPKPTSKLGKAIKTKFGSFEKMKEAFGNAAKSQFGSGWAWLCVKRAGSLDICGTSNQDNPLMPKVGSAGIPILGLDVWEHAYYLKYQNKRPEYVEAFFNLINWDEVAKRYNAASKTGALKSLTVKKKIKASKAKKAASASKAKPGPKAKGKPGPKPGAKRKTTAKAAASKPGPKAKGKPGPKPGAKRKTTAKAAASKPGPKAKGKPGPKPGAKRKTTAKAAASKPGPKAKGKPGPKPGAKRKTTAKAAASKPGPKAKGKPGPKPSAKRKTTAKTAASKSGPKPGAKRKTAPKAAVSPVPQVAPVVTPPAAEKTGDDKS